MKKLYPFILFYISFSITAQTSRFPQGVINNLGKDHPSERNVQSDKVVKPENNSGAFKMLEKIEEIKKTNWDKFSSLKNNTSRTSVDTLIVGLTPNDTLFVTDTFNHNGPIWVLGDGVLIFYNATVINTGDIIVFQHGRVLSESSSLTFPQAYFYQRTMIIVQHGIGYFSNTSFNYSGIQHGLVVGDSAQAGFVNVHQADWTTAGLFGKGTLWMNNVNLGGEFILSDTSNTYFNNVDSLLLWHQIPSPSLINCSFPNGTNVMGYQFNNSVPGISGIDYNVSVDSCETVWWGLMPVNGSDVTVSNSDIRAIGCWFKNGDTATVSNVYDNTNYSNTVMPFTDRNIHLINTFVTTWSLYVFDSSSIIINNSAVGEVGTQQKSMVNSSSFLLDGSGGYFWATDSSVTVASDVTVYSTARSEKNGLFILGYSTLPFSTPTSIHSSIFISTQNNLPADPIPYDASTMWMQNIESPGIAHADSLISVKGSEWIDQGPEGGILFYQKYSLYYQLYGASSWVPIVIDSFVEIRHNTLGVWNTNGLVSGTYLLRLVVKDTYADSVESFKAVSLLPGIATGINDQEPISISIFPNPANDHLILSFPSTVSFGNIQINDITGRCLEKMTVHEQQNIIDISGLPPGTYILEHTSAKGVIRRRFVKE
jgi:hypothetical protein